MTLQRVRSGQQASTIRFHALGAIEVVGAQGPRTVGGPRQRRLVAMLLLHRGHIVSVDRLAEAVFAGEPTPAAATTLRSYVARLRRVIQDDDDVRLLTQAPGYVLQVRDDAFDVARFEALVEEARAARARDDASTTAALLHEALALWRGDAYAEFADEEWAVAEVQRLTELRLAALELRFEVELALGRAADVVPELEAAACAHPWREALRAHLMIALYRAGRQREALQAFQSHRVALGEELGLDPGPALRELEERILRHDQELLLTPDAAVVRGYQLLQRLGSGQDGTVHAARLPGVDRDVVLRSLRTEVADDPELIRSFDPVLRRVASLEHPAVVTIHDHWREPGQAHIVLRRLHGGSLADRLQAGALSLPDVVALVRRVGGALAAAHDVGVQHRALTARNVLYDEAGEPYLTDFTVPGMATTGRDDVHDLAVVVRTALGPGAPAAVDDLLEAILAGARPPVADLVDRLVGLLTGEAAPPPLLNPYKGLRAFDEGDADDYHGRTALIDDLIDRLGDDGIRGRLVLVVGGSGTGKSSAVRAGLLPRVRRGDVPGSERWYATAMLPGPTPFKELAEALRRIATEAELDALSELDAPGALDAAVRALCPIGGEVLLVVDQLDELFTASPDEQQRAFLDALVDAIEAPGSRVRVVATLRADLFDRPLAFHRFGALVEAATVPIPAMAPAEIEAAIVQPAARVGRQIEGALVAELVSAVANEPGALPALQFTLFELAEHEREVIRLDAYRALGGVEGAIAARAEQLYRSLRQDERPVVRAVFEQLVTVGAAGPPTRCIVPRSELVGGDHPETTEEVVDRWASARLLTLDRHQTTRAPTVEVGHEALLREWPRLRRWIDEGHDRLVLLAGLRDAAATWEELGRDPGALYRGARLQAALDVAGASPSLPERQREFLDASQEQRDRDAEAAASQAERQARSNRRLRQQLAVIGVALVVALVGGVVALDQRSEAEDGRRIATVRELAAAAQASVDEDPERAVLLALEAIAAGGEDDPAPEAVDALHGATTSSRILLTVPGLGGSLDWSPDGALFVTEGPEEEGIVDLRDARTGASVRSFRGHRIDINDVAFSPDSERLATTGDDSALRVWDVASGDEVLSVRGELDEDVVWGASFSRDGRLVAASWFDEGVVRVVDVASGETVLEVPDAPTWTTALDRTGARLFIAPFDRAPVVLDVRTGEPVLALDGEQQTIREAQWSPDGRSLAAGGSNGTAVVWDGATGERRITVTGHTAEVSGVDWSPDGTKLATSSHDGTARVHELLDGGARELHVVYARDTRNGLQSVSFSPDAERMMTGDWGIAAVKVWDVSDQAGGEMAIVPTVPFARGSGAFLPEGRAVVAGVRDGGLGVWDAATGDLLRSFAATEAGDGELYRLALHPEGRVVAVTTDLLPVHLYDLRTGAHLRSLGGTSPPCGPPEAGPPCTFVVDMSWSPDGRRLAIAEGTDHGGGGAVTVVDRAGTVISRMQEEPDTYVRDLAWSPDGTRIATTRTPPRDDPARMGFRVWDAADGELLLRVRTQTVALAWDPAGDRIVTTKQTEGGADVWEATTGDHHTELRATAPFYAVAFDPHGDVLATTGADGVIRLWDAERGVQVGTLRGSTRELNALEFSADGRHLSSLDDQGSLRVWILDLDELIEVARSRVTRTLTDEECRQYLRLESCADA